MGAALKLDLDRIPTPLRLVGSTAPNVAEGKAPTVVKLLLIEQDALAARRVRRSLEQVDSQRFDVVHVETLDAALTSEAGHRFDVILFDLSQQDANGIEGFLRMKTTWGDVPVVVLTAHNDQFVGARAMMAGASGHLLKGRVDARGLMRSIRYAMQRPMSIGDISGRRVSRNPLHIARNDSQERIVPSARRPSLRLCPVLR